MLAQWQAWIPAAAQPLLSVREARLLPAQALVEAHILAALPCEPDALLTSMAVI